MLQRLADAGAAVRSIGPFRIELATRERSLQVRLDGMFKRHRHGEVTVDAVVDEIAAALGLPGHTVSGPVLPRLVRSESIRDGELQFPCDFDPALAVVLVKERPHGFLRLRLDGINPEDSPEGLLDAALQALDERTAGVEVEGMGSGSGLNLGFATGDGFDAARALLPQRLLALAEWIPGQARVAIPSANLLLVVGDEDPETLEEAGQFVARTFEQDPAPLSPRMYLLDESGRPRPATEASES